MDIRLRSDILGGITFDFNKEERLKQMLNKLYKITEEQDILNIGIIKLLDDDTDERWIPLHMIDNANAIILGISRNKAKPKSIINEGYVGDKLESLNGKWTNLNWRIGK